MTARKVEVTDTSPPAGTVFSLSQGEGAPRYRIGGVHSVGGRECWIWDKDKGRWGSHLQELSGWSHVYVVPDPSVDDRRFPHRCRCGSPAYFGVTPAAYECSNSGCLRPVMEGR